MEHSYLQAPGATVDFWAERATSRTHGRLNVSELIAEVFSFVHSLHQAYEIPIDTCKATEHPLIHGPAISEHTAKPYETTHDKDVTMI